MITWIDLLTFYIVFSLMVGFQSLRLASEEGEDLSDWRTWLDAAGSALLWPIYCLIAVWWWWRE